MPIDFHAERNRFTYAQRQADLSWVEKIQEMIDLRGKKAVDIGCGGGIYAKVLAELGAAHVTGVDSSEVTLRVAKESCHHYEQIDFVQGDALDTGLPTEQYDVVLQRALIHHLPQDRLAPCFTEAFRLLKKGGLLLVQNRTPEDCLLPGSKEHIRGYFFELFPQLCAKEVSRRHTDETVREAMRAAGFRKVEEHKLWETRRVFDKMEQMEADLLARVGRSILHELSDAELKELVLYIQAQLAPESGQGIVERDCWTIWLAVKES